MKPRLPLRIGIRIAPTPELALPAPVRMAVTAAERLGYDAVWAIGDDPEEVLGVVTEAADATEEIRIGVGMLVGENGLRPEQQAALPTLHRLAAGRLTLGIAVSAALTPDRAERAVDAIHEGWDPAVAPRPPLVLAAHSEEGVELVARRADGWLADDVPVAELAERWEALRSRADAHGRETALAMVVPAWVGLVDEPLPDGRPDYQGDVDQVADDVLVAAAAGAEEVVLMPAGEPTLDELLDVCARVAEALEVGMLSRPG